MSHRLERRHKPSLRNYAETRIPAVKENAVINCGWGRLIFGQTFRRHKDLIKTICGEQKGRRDIAFYIRDPHVMLSMAPQELFLDPSHTYRLWLDQYRPSRRRFDTFIVRMLTSKNDVKGVNDVYIARHMTIAPPQFIWKNRGTRTLTYLVAEDKHTGEIVGTVMGVDHKIAFNDIENGCSLWCLAVDPQASQPGIGEALVRQLAEHYLAKGRTYMDLSVLHDNEQAIALYDKLGFVRVPVFCVKHKINPVNEKLFTGPGPDKELNPYAKIIIDEARIRGIAVELLDDSSGYFRLTFGGRSIVCHESLTEMTSAIAFNRCANKRVTLKILANHGLRVPDQIQAGSDEQNKTFLKKYGSIVVKPLDSEQGRGISVGIRKVTDLRKAVKEARAVSDDVLIEEYVKGQDLRIVVVDFKVGAAAVRRPPKIVGTGEHTIEALIEKQSRRRQAATGGESHIPLDEETERCVKDAGYKVSDILPKNDELTVRKAANLHTGGTIHDVTPELHPHLKKVAEDAAKILDIPVVGFDLMVEAVDGDKYVFIEANERPGLANHEPQPLPQRFIDFLFPQTIQTRTPMETNERLED